MQASIVRCGRHSRTYNLDARSLPFNTHPHLMGKARGPPPPPPQRHGGINTLDDWGPLHRRGRQLASSRLIVSGDIKAGARAEGIDQMPRGSSCALFSASTSASWSCVLKKTDATRRVFGEISAPMRRNLEQLLVKSRSGVRRGGDRDRRIGVGPPAE